MKRGMFNDLHLVQEISCYLLLGSDSFCHKKWSKGDIDTVDFFGQGRKTFRLWLKNGVPRANPQ